MIGAPHITNPEGVHNRIANRISTPMTQFLIGQSHQIGTHPFACLPAMIDIAARILADVNRSATADLFEAIAHRLRATEHDAGTTAREAETLQALYASIAFAAQPARGTA